MVALHNQYAGSGFDIYAFPSADFGGQEFGTDAEIKKFVSKYDPHFPLFSKVNVKGAKADPIFKFLKKSSGDSEPSWNFGKYLVDSEGHVYKYYSPQTSVRSIAGDVEKLLAQAGKETDL